MGIDQMKEDLQEILHWQRTKQQEYLASTLNKLDPEQFNEIVNELLEKVSAAEAREYGIKNFEQIDRYPNPRDGVLSRDEITERLHFSRSTEERSILLWIWLSFDSIRESSDDFEGEDKPFDIVLTLSDFEKMKV